MHWKNPIVPQIVTHEFYSLRHSLQELILGTASSAGGTVPAGVLEHLPNGAGNTNGDTFNSSAEATEEALKDIDISQIKPGRTYERTYGNHAISPPGYYLFSFIKVSGPYEADGVPSLPRVFSDKSGTVPEHPDSHEKNESLFQHPVSRACLRVMTPSPPLRE